MKDPRTEKFCSNTSNHVQVVPPTKSDSADDVKRSRPEPITAQQFKSWLDGYIAGKNNIDNDWSENDIKLIKAMSDRIMDSNYINIPNYYPPLPVGAPPAPWISTPYC